MKLKLVKLRDLAVGAIFIRHDEWGDGQSLHVKISDHGYDRGDKSACGVGRVASGYSGPLVADIDVQEVKMGPELAAIAFTMAYGMGEFRKATDG